MFTLSSRNDSCRQDEKQRKVEQLYPSNTFTAFHTFVPAAAEHQHHAVMVFQQQLPRPNTTLCESSTNSKESPPESFPITPSIALQKLIKDQALPSRNKSSNRRDEDDFPSPYGAVSAAGVAASDAPQQQTVFSKAEWLEAIRQEKARVQTILDEEQLSSPDASCPSCLYVGTGTCLGLAGYFGYLGLLTADESNHSSIRNSSSPTKHPCASNNPKLNLAGMQQRIMANEKIQAVRMNEASTQTRGRLRNATATTTQTPTSLSFTAGLFHGRHPRPAASRTPNPTANHRPSFFILSAGWACVGAYRWHLG